MATTGITGAKGPMGPVGPMGGAGRDRLGELTAAIDALVAEGPGCCFDAESIVELERQRQRLDALVTASVAAFDTWGEWALDGARSAATWLTRRSPLSGTEARRQVRRGRTCSDLGAFARSWGTGAISGEHIDLVAKVRNPRSEEALVRDEALLVTLAEDHPYPEFECLLARWALQADPDGAEERLMDQCNRRDVYLVPSFGGTYLGRMTLDPVSGAIVSTEFERLCDELFEADWAEAHRRLGRDPGVDDLARSAAQRRADALVEMATRSAARAPGARRPAPLISVLVGYESLHGALCQLEHSAIALPPGSVLRLLEHADIERAVFTPGGRVDVGITTRCFSGATRRAIELRDGTCTHPYCDEPAYRCQVDHIVEFAKGGETTQENGRLLCPRHNRLRNQRPPPGD